MSDPNEPSRSSKGRVTFVTATFARDIDRFVLQRESLEKCGIEIPHVAVVNDEDMPRFRDIPFQRGLTLISTKEVLPRKLELRRRAKRYRMRHPLRWIGRKPLEGWWIQQLAKLASPAFIQTEGIVSLDSDTCFVRKVTDADFFTNGRLHLYETKDGLIVTTVVWLGRCMHFLGVTTDLPVRQYIHNPVPMHRQVLLELHRYIEQRHKMPWMTAMLQWNATEYSTYGVYARHIHQAKDLHPLRPPMSVSYWMPGDVVDFEADFVAKMGDPAVKIVNLQSHTKLNFGMFRERVSDLWPQSTKPVVEESIA